MKSLGMQEVSLRISFKYCIITETLILYHIVKILMVPIPNNRSLYLSQFEQQPYELVANTKEYCTWTPGASVFTLA